MNTTADRDYCLNLKINDKAILEHGIILPFETIPFLIGKIKSATYCCFFCLWNHKTVDSLNVRFDKNHKIYFVFDDSKYEWVMELKAVII